jgi:hypothetical protein
MKEKNQKILFTERIFPKVHPNINYDALSLKFQRIQNFSSVNHLNTLFHKLIRLNSI